MIIMTDLMAPDLMAVFAGGFVAAGTECVVVLKTDVKTEMVLVVSQNPCQTPEILLKSLANHFETTVDNLSVKVFCMCGGFDRNRNDNDKPRRFAQESRSSEVEQGGDERCNALISTGG